MLMTLSGEIAFLEAQPFKIIAISKKNSGSRVVSLGHRNPQGLDYSTDFDYLISTEHGPAGGDEVNLNIDTENIKNFGWPISSYGRSGAAFIG